MKTHTPSKTLYISILVSQVYVLQVVFVLAIDERDDDYVFRLAGKRYEDMKPSLKTE